MLRQTLEGSRRESFIKIDFRRPDVCGAAKACEISDTSCLGHQIDVYVDTEAPFWAAWWKHPRDTLT